MSAMYRRALLLIATLALLAACGSVSPAATAPAGSVRASVPRASVAVAPAQAAALRNGNAVFAGRLLALVARTNPTVALSPWSISQALSMTYAGARGSTATQIARALDFRLPLAKLAAAFDAAGQSLDKANDSQTTLDIANALYGQQGQSFRQAFLKLLARDYGAGMRTVDFKNASAAARATINAWVSGHTAGKIPQLLGPGDVTPSTVLMLVNAVYLKAKWTSPFNAQNTYSAPFNAPTGVVDVPTMHQTASYGYLQGSGYQALELPYQDGRLAFDVLLPAPGGLTSLLTRLSNRGPLQLLGGLTQKEVALALPKLLISTRFQLAGALGALGMPIAFKPGLADLSGIAGVPGDLYISAVVHQAYLRVDETGTEAAAATGVGVSPTAIAAPAVRFTVDRPFVFVLRDTKTGAVLFTGVVSHP